MLEAALEPGRAMPFVRYLSGLRDFSKGGQHSRRPRKARFRPRLEGLEERALLSFLAPADYGSAAGVNASTDSVALGDFNGDGKLDVAVANLLNFNVSVFLNNGNGTLGVPIKYATGPGPTAGSFPQSINGGDFNGDGKL